ncbi:transposase [Actinomyces oris]|uniref:transposase n=1 Tax=Actinomyces oris TaxID=544580 RepID=UPI003D1828DE
MASHAGPAPATRRSGSSTRGEQISHGGNKRLKHAMFLSAFVSLHPIPSARPSTSANATKVNAITRPSSPWPTAAS